MSKKNFKKWTLTELSILCIGVLITTHFLLHNIVKYL